MLELIENSTPLLAFALFLAIVAVFLVAILLKRIIFSNSAKSNPNPDRLFSAEQKRCGHRRAGYRCEYTDTRTKQRCKNKSVEGDHFYPYGKGGATEISNFVSACRYHNQTKSGNIWQHEKAAIESRRRDYFKAKKVINIGSWRTGPIRMVFTINNQPIELSCDNSEILVRSFKEGIAKYNNQTKANLQGKINKLNHLGDVFDFIWKTEHLHLEQLNGVNPVTGEWMPLGNYIAKDKK